MKNLKEQISLIIAIIAFIISGITFYLTYLQSPELDFEAGEKIEIYKNAQGNKFNQMIIPFSFVNHSNSAGSIMKIEAILSKLDNTHSLDTALWEQFIDKIPIRDTSKKDYIAHNLINTPIHMVSVITIPPKSADYRFIDFKCSEKIDINASEYKLTIKVYTNYSECPITKEYNFNYNNFYNVNLKSINHEKN